jgi:HEAT repeat protein
LIDRLADPDYRSREWATGELARRGEVVFVPLVRAREGGEEIRWRADRILAGLGWPRVELIRRSAEAGPAALALILPLLRTDRIDWVVEGAGVLARLDPPEVVGRLRFLQGDAEPRVRYHLAVVLGGLGSPAGVPILEGLNRDEDEAVAFAAAAGLYLCDRPDSFDRTVADLVKEIEDPAKAMVAFYNLACLQALIGEVETAWGHLDRATTLGFRDFLWIRRDPDLYRLRSDPRFQERLRILEEEYRSGAANPER